MFYKKAQRTFLTPMKFFVRPLFYQLGNKKTDKKRNRRKTRKVWRPEKKMGHFCMLALLCQLDVIGIQIFTPPLRREDVIDVQISSSEKHLSRYNLYAERLAIPYLYIFFLDSTCVYDHFGI